MLNKLQNKLILIFGVLQIVAMVISQLVIGSQLTNSFKDNLDVIGAEEAKNLTQITDLRISNYAKDLLHFSDETELKDILENTKTLTPSMIDEWKSFTKINPDVSTIYAGDSTKHMYDSEPDVYGKSYDPHTRPWYKLANEDKDNVKFSPPYKDSIDQKMTISISKAVVENNKVLGVIAMDVNLDEITKQVNETNVGYDGFGFILDSTGDPVVLPGSDGKNQRDKPFVEKMYSEGKDSGKIQYTEKGVKKILYYTTSPVTGWKIGAFYKESNLLTLSNHIQNMSLTITICTIVISAIIVFFVARFFTKPIIQLTKQVRLMAEGDLTVQGTVRSKDEIGQLTGHFNQMVQSVREVLTNVIDSSGKLSDSAVNLSAVSEETKATSEEIAHAMSDVAQGAAESAKNLDDMHQVTGYLASQFILVEKTMNSMQQKSNETQQASISGRETLAELQSRSKESFSEIQSIEQVLELLVNKISDIQTVVEIIKSISAQTNLLALNASIEAARAGEAGRGFSVVATEVRKLAEQSAASTEQIRETIQGIMEEAEHATEAMVRTKEISSEQNEAVHATEVAFTNIQGLMHQVIESINGMSKEVQEMSALKENVVQSIQSLSAISEESAAAAEEVSASSQDQLKAIETVTQSAESLSQSSSGLESLVKKFKIYRE
ncbi:methyl-accepting chemotaxis protein [Paenibacillus sp.]|jgi:methyl-accepting chemotaxis protein|uniref:methyl-accepting chemotaxis protein n=1 Tax=Paenibacillus sp. TaxID=58172 RepID=UPI00282DA9DA|nr:methyl-accepting chemotaxis protein [Paenibacillus sp.]MDR0271170.1 methyl-accepting chemotaxis protein [Paenibacillus sp.]